MIKLRKLCLIFLCIGFQLIAQDIEKKWTIGASAGVAKFSSLDARITGDQFILQIPKLHMSRYLSRGISFDVGFSASLIGRVSGVFDNSRDYLSIDLGTKYDFRQSDQNLVPFLFAGTSFIRSKGEITPTLNVGGGTLFWLTPSYGIQPQLLYKKVRGNTTSMRSHGYFSIGLVYSLKPRILVPRLWSMRE